MTDIILGDAKVGAQNKIVIPKAARVLLQLEQEDYLRFIVRDGVVRVEKTKQEA